MTISDFYLKWKYSFLKGEASFRENQFPKFSLIICLHYFIEIFQAEICSEDIFGL